MAHRLPSSRRTRRRRIASICLTSASLVATAACGGDPTAVSDADVEYATAVTSHHAQTLQLLDLSLGRSEVSPRLGALADRTRQRLFAEVGTTQKWLKQWGEPVPATTLEHTHDESRHYDTSAPGMLATEDLHALQDVRGPRFTRGWLGGLIQLERGAIETAQRAVTDGQNAAVVKAARADLAFHRSQLEELQRAR